MESINNVLFSFYTDLFPHGTRESFHDSFGFTIHDLELIYDEYILGIVEIKWFLIVLEYINCYPKGHVQACYWGMSYMTYQTHLHRSIDLILDALPDFDMDERLAEEEPTGLFENIRCVCDVTEVRTRRPRKINVRRKLTRWEKRWNWKYQKILFSDKKKMHSIKYQIIVSIVTGRILNVSKLQFGRKHDKRIFDEWITTQKDDIFLPEERILGDRAYDGDLLFMSPAKEYSGKTLTSTEVTFNEIVGDARLIVEQSIGRIKKFGILQQLYRSPFQTHERIFMVCAKLANLSMKFRPLRKNPCKFLFK